MVSVCIKIDPDNKWNFRKRAEQYHWDMSRLVRRLMEMWLAGDILAGKPRPIKKRFQTQSFGFKIPTELRQAFNTKSQAAGWTSAALIRRLLDLWYDQTVDVGNCDKTRFVAENGELVKVFTLKEASQVLGVCCLTVRRHIVRDGVQGKRVNITECDLEALRLQLGRIELGSD